MEILGVISSLFEIFGIYLLSKRNRLGFLSNMIGNVGWIAYSAITKTAIGLIIVCTVTLIINQRGFLAWRNQ